jgi:hypothetical protein
MVQALKNLALFAVGFGILWAMLRLDMSTGGTVAAQHVHHAFPECSGPCHG